MLRRTLSITACCLLLTAIGQAAPLHRADVAKDAKWVVHVDLEALADSEIAEKAGDKWPEKAKKMQNWMQQQLGVTPQEDLKSLTMFSNKYEKHSGVAILSADFERKKVVDMLESKDDVDKTEWNNYTLYTYKVSKHHKSDNGNENDESGSNHAYNGQDSPKQMTSVLVDRKTMVCAASPERAKWAIEILEGESPSLKDLDEPKLTSEKTEDALVFATAIDLSELPEAGGKLGVLRQHKSICYVLEEQDDTLHEEYTFTAVNEEIASKMKEAVQGLIALAEVWSTDMEQFNEMLNEASIEQQGNELRVSWEGSPGEAITAIEQLAQRAGEWRQERQQR